MEGLKRSTAVADARVWMSSADPHDSHRHRRAIDCFPSCRYKPGMQKLIYLAAIVFLGGGAFQGEGHEHAVRLTINSELPGDVGRIPLDSTVDFGVLIRKAGLAGALDPGSIKVVNLATGKHIPSGVTEDFAYADAGQVEWVIDDPAHKAYNIRFRTAAERPPLTPQAHSLVV